MKVLIVILSLLLLCACQSSQVNLTHKLEQSPVAAVDYGACDLYLHEFDNLVTQADVGTVARTQVDIDVAKWATLSLQRANISSENVKDYQLKVTLLKSYIRSVHTSMVANVVFKVEHRHGTEDVYQAPQYFRGKAVSTNWASGEGELFETLSEAMDNALIKLKRHYSEGC